MKRITTLCLTLCAMLVGAKAQTADCYQNVAPRRSEFITFSKRNLAEKGDRGAEQYYLNLHYRLTSTTQNEDGSWSDTYQVELPLIWRDRTVFLHTEGGANNRSVSVNGKFVGRCKDEYAPSEFIISPYLQDGITEIVITSDNHDRRPAEMVATNTSEPVVFLYSQPAVRIHDVMVDTKPGENGQCWVLNIDVIITSSRRAPEPVSVGYDIYSPEKELKYYDIREMSASGHNKLDTLHLQTNIYGAMERLWSAEDPKLYELTLYIKQNRIITEYLLLKVGFTETTYDAEHIYRNGEPIELNTVWYNANESQKSTEADIRRLKKEGFNTIRVDYPQPWWFYDMCDKIGMYVIDQANINTDDKNGNMGRNGTLANNPAWLGEFIEREASTYWRSRLHPCVIAYSIGGASGSGYNMYKCYEWLKSVEPNRPIVYGGGEWNSDVKLPE